MNRYFESDDVVGCNSTERIKFLIESHKAIGWEIKKTNPKFNYAEMIKTTRDGAKHRVTFFLRPGSDEWLS